jgi:ABC-type transport system involved in multi-copper enzyme maturation permease subunit
MATTSTVPVTAERPALPGSAGRASFAGALRSEFTKIRSVRSTYWTLLATLVVVIGIGALFSYGAAHNFSQLPTAAQAHQRAQEIANATERSLFGLILGQLIIAAAGALTITSEYTTGMIRTSLSVLPRRGTVFAAKALVFGVIAVAAGLVSSFASYFLGQAILSGQHINSTLGQPGVLRAVIGGGLFLGVCGLLSFGLGALIRHTAGAITASFGLLFVLVILAGFLPSSWAVHVDKWVPTNAGGAIWEKVTGVHPFSPWTGFAVFCGYAALALAAGLYRFRNRDA